ncbi:hypothetical protein pdam_00008493 [Pocillopora damicornis]|uniref:Uncharacterized protein n=1 Tax=Pocillopora damicornis TaxID=46731 RepID=A0A3M6U4Z7_POCDA|nr:hypothetical protein pdam_00008493 [Pocillopora damicornis]
MSHKEQKTGESQPSSLERKLFLFSRKPPNTVSSPNRHKMTEMKSTSRATKPLFLKSAKESKSF